MTTYVGAPGAMPAGFEVGRVLGRGGSGTVYEARQHSTGRAVALKIVDLDVGGPEVHRRFARERSAMGELAGHPHIVSILDAGVHEGRAWLAMDFCPGGSLAGQVRPLAAAQALGLLHAIGSALAAAHARGVLHCDVKPGNILVTGYGQPALGDFGIARLTVESQASRIGGYTLDHVPPEILRGAHPTDRGDVYSLGTTVWQLLEGRPPFRRDGDTSEASILRRIDAEPLPPMQRRDLPPGLDALLAAMTAKDPAHRPSAVEVMGHAAEIARGAGLPLHTLLAAPGAVAPSSAPSYAPSTTAPGAWTSSVPPTSSLPPAAVPAPRTAGEPEAGSTGGARPVVAAPPRRRRRRGLKALALLVVVLVAMGGGAVLAWRYLPPTVVAAPVTPAPSVAPTALPAAPTASGATPVVSPAAPLVQPKIALTLLCRLKTPTTCAGRGSTQPYRSEVTDAANEPIYDGCFDYTKVTGPKGVVQEDSFPCNTAGTIYTANNSVLPDGDYTITEHVEMQDGVRSDTTLRFSVRS